MLHGLVNLAKLIPAKLWVNENQALSLYTHTPIPAEMIYRYIKLHSRGVKGSLNDPYRGLGTWGCCTRHPKPLPLCAPGCQGCESMSSPPPSQSSASSQPLGSAALSAHVQESHDNYPDNIFKEKKKKSSPAQAPPLSLLPGRGGGGKPKEALSSVSISGSWTAEHLIVSQLLAEV